ncbi:MAG: DUF1178 family protein [Pseudorhodoplanes sp.]
MIRYALICERKHEFEAWFQTSSDYDKQRKRGLVTCPLCDSGKVEKAIMAPAIARGGKRRAEPVAAAKDANKGAEAPVADAGTEPAKAPFAMVPPQEREFRAKLKELRDHMVRNADDVGRKFPEEARKMHYGEIEHRSIYGEASPDEARALHDEGIEFHPLPVLPDDKN